MIKSERESLLRDRNKDIFPFVVHKIHKYYCSESRIRSFFHRWSTVHHAFSWIPRSTCIILSAYEHSATILFSVFPASWILQRSCRFWFRQRSLLLAHAFTVAPQRSRTDRPRASRFLWLRRKFFFHYRAATIPFSTRGIKRGKFFQFGIMSFVFM